MAKKKKRKAARVGGLRLSEPMVHAALAALQSPVGKLIIAELLVQAAAVLTTRHPTAAATAAGAGTAQAATNLAAGARDAAISFLHFASDLLKGSQHGAKPNHSPRSEGDDAFHRGGNGHAGDGGTPDRGAVREILMGEFSGKKSKKKNKHADRH